MAKKVKQIFQVRDDGQTVYYTSFSDVVANLKLTNSRVRKSGSLSFSVSQVDEDHPQWSDLDWGIQNYYNSRISDWREAGRKNPPKWEDWQSLDYETRRDDFDSRFSTYLRSFDLEENYQSAA